MNDPALLKEYIGCARDAGFMLADDGTKFSLGYSIPQEGCDLLRELVLRERPKTIVEIGMALGSSTAYIASAVAELKEPCRFIVIDPFQERHWKNVGLKTLRDLNLQDYVELHQDFSHIALSRLETEGTTVDFAFVDGSHLFDYVMTDFLLLDRIFAIGGTMVFDDIQWPAVLKAMRFVLKNRSYRPLLAESSTVVPWNPNPLEKLKVGIGRVVPPFLQKYLAPEVWLPNWDLGIRGRFLAIRKEAMDGRGDQEMFHKVF